jgi:hypothetical protein
MLAVSGSPVSEHPGVNQGTPIQLSVQSGRWPPREAAANPSSPYPAQTTQPIEPILIPKLRIRLAEFPYATLFYAPETAHLGDLMRIRYGWTEAQRILPSHWLF